MKKNYLLLSLIFCLFSSVSIAQIQDLAKIAEGKIVYSTTLFDSDHQLFGYFYLYEKDKEDKEHKTMEYVLLDKNLNSVANKEFTEKLYKRVYSKYYNCTLMGDKIILNKYYYYYTTFRNILKPLLTSYKIISLKDNTVSADFKYEDGNFSELVADFDDMKSEYKGNDTKSIIHAFNFNNIKGFFIDESNSGKSYKDKEIKFYNEEKQNIWNFEYNPSPSRSKYSSYSFLHAHDNTLYIGLSKLKLRAFSTPETGDYKIVEYKITAVDMHTGKTKFEYPLEKSNADTIHVLNVKEIDKKLIITGLYSGKNNLNSFTFVPHYLGVYRIVLNEEGKVLEKKYYNWSKFSDKIEISEKGSLKDGFSLQALDYFIFKDGSVGILTEGAKAVVIGGGYVFKNYVLFTFDKDFNVKSASEIKTEKDVDEDGFLFSQYIKDESGALFFYSQHEKNQETKDKNYYLYINKIINGEYTFEKIPLTAKKKFAILPYPAKEGYIMLQEYNEDEKYNQIRLERLND